MNCKRGLKNYVSTKDMFISPNFSVTKSQSCMIVVKCFNFNACGVIKNENKKLFSLSENRMNPPGRMRHIYGATSIAILAVEH